MKNEIEIIKNLLLPLLGEEKSILTKNSSWNLISSGFILFESDPKPLYTEIYKLETPNPENVISKLPELYDSFIDEIAEEYVLGIVNPVATKLIEQDSSLFIERVAFLNTLKSGITKQERLKIRKELPNLADRVNYSFSEKNIEVAIKKKAREDLKIKFTNWDHELKEKPNKKGKVISLSWFKYAAAAIVVLSFLIWQPSQSSNDDLFSDYGDNISSLTKDNYNLFNTSNVNNGERGNDYGFIGYTNIENKLVLSGLTFFKEGNYDKAKSILTEINLKEHSVEVFYFLSLAQLNSNDTETAIKNLEYLKNKKDLKFIDDVNFHLAMGYIKKGNRKKSKILLKQLLVNKSKFKDKAELILKKMRWF